jgi:Glycosyltransferase family 87
MTSILTRERVAYYCTLLLIAAFAIQVFSVIKDREIGGDFMTFYAAGRITLNYPHSQLYNLDIQEIEYQKIAGKTGYSTFGYTPWFSIPLAVLARLPYLVAFGLWTSLSIFFLFLAYRLLAHVEGLPRSWNNLGFLACLAFPPYLFYSLLNGHPSAFALLVVAGAYVLQKRGHNFLTGMTLALLSYKPTLLVFVAPMLVFTRQWKSVLGLILGGSILGLLGIAWVGIDGTVAFLNLLRIYSQAINSHTEIFQTYKYIDLGAAIRLLLGPHGFVRPVLLLFSFPLVCFLWYRIGARPISWALAIVTGLLFNLYTPIYDCTLLIFAVAVIGVRNLNSWLVVALYLVSLGTVPFAEATRIQLYTFVLILLFTVLVKSCRVLAADLASARGVSETVPT